MLKVFSALVLGVLLLAAVEAQAPSYAPYYVECPSGQLLNDTGSAPANNQTLSPDEVAYTTARRQRIQQVWQQYLANTTYGDTGYNSSLETPSIAIAASGGGLRASLNGAGAVSAIDGRNATSVAPILQLAEFMTGLSGGSWFVSSLAMNDLPDMFSLVLGSQQQTGWLLNYDIVTPGRLLTFGDSTAYYSALVNDVRTKSDAGWPTSLVDVWGRALAYHFYNGTTSSNFFSESDPHSEGLIWSSIRYTQNFQSYEMPLPIIVADSRINETVQMATATTTVIPLSQTVFEFTPFSFGSFDPNLTTIMDVRIAGTPLDNGQPANSSACVHNYENAAFAIGTSAALFNAVENVEGADTLVSFITTVGNLLTGINETPNSVDLVANWPNSFRNYKTGVFESANNEILQVTRRWGENVPLGPLLVKTRGVDVIFAIDSSADTNYFWPNGTSLIATQDRVNSVLPQNWTSGFPQTPTSQEQYVAQGLNVRPTFFGCNATDANSTTPIVVYLPNAPVPGYANTNTSTFQLGYDNDETLNFLTASHANGIRGIPNADGSNDSQYPLALKCIMAEPSRRRANIARSSACETVLSKYCWNGSTNADVSQAPGTSGSSGGGTGGARPSNAGSSVSHSLSAVLVVMATAGLALLH